MEDRSIRIVRDLLPDEWVVREYRPDYGIDLTIELFGYVDEARSIAATLGETLFVQVKSTEVVTPARLRVRARRNVELGPLRENPADTMQMEVAKLRIETSELLMVQAIGAAIPVMLFLVELSTKRIYFVCLNDLIDKVILPKDSGYASKATRVLNIPLRNRIVPDDLASIRPLETYAKRAKLYAAFQKFAYQRHELDWAFSTYQAAAEEQSGERGREFLNLVRHFLSILLRYDFWTRMNEWQPIYWAHQEIIGLQELLADPEVEQREPSLRAYLSNAPGMRFDPEWVESLDLPDLRQHVLMHIAVVWQRLDNLAGIYEELGREWFLPTHLSSHLVDI